MIRALAVLGFLGVLSQGLFAQDVEWVETRFHRVHLRNGNFIDGQLSDQTSAQLSLRMKVGDMVIKNDQIDWIELVKMRSLREKPKAIPKSPARAAVAATVESPRTAGGAKIPIDLSPDALRIRPAVVELLERYRQTIPTQRTPLVAQILQTGEEVATVLASLLEETEGEARDNVVEILGYLKDRRGVPALLKLLATSSPDLRADVAKLLGQAGDDRAASPLRELLRDPQAVVRSGVLEALGNLGDERGLDAILEACTDSDRGVRGKAVAVSLQLGHKFKAMDQVCRGLVGAADRADSALRPDLILAIGLTRSREGESTLLAAMNDSDPAVRTQAIKAIGSSDGPSAKKSILERIRVEMDPAPRVQLAIAANRMKLMDAVDSMIGWLREEDKEVQAAVGTALRGMTGKEFGTDGALWQQWWEGARGRK